MSIQNPGPEIFQEVRERGLARFSVLKKTESQTWGRNGNKKKRVQEFLYSVFFSPFPPHAWDSGFFSDH
jgi:hypothetical protein